MRYFLLIVATVAWALWIGGTIATFVIGTALFADLGRAAAGPPADVMFHAFRTYELGLAGVAIVSAGMALVTYPSKALVLLTGCLLMAGAIMFAVTLGFIPQMDILSHRGQAGSPEFMRWHVRSMIGMTVQAGILLLAAFTLPSAAVPDPGNGATAGRGSPAYDRHEAVAAGA